MLEIFEALPFGVTTLLVAALSLGLVALSTLFVPNRRLWLMAFVVPLLTAWTIYWTPYWVRPHTNSADYGAWVMLFLAAWGGAGVSASLIFVAFFLRLKKRTAPHV
jgi:hypothetical protein